MALGNTSKQLADRLIQKGKELPAEKVRRWVLLLTCLWLISMLADIFWMLVPAPKSVASDLYIYAGTSTSSSTAKTSSSQVDINEMKTWKLFGDPAAVEVEEKAPAEDVDLNAPVTNLRLSLQGIIHSSNENMSIAIIERQSKANLYRIGDRIEGERGVTVLRILTDRVLIDNRGREETILLYDESKEPLVQKHQSVPSQNKRTIDHREDEKLRQMASDYRQQLMTNPMSLAEVIKISEARDGEGNLMGYQVNPGTDRKQFQEFGLRPGDIITSVNGVALDDPSKAMELYGLMKTAREATFTLNRGGQEIDLVIGWTQ